MTNSETDYETLVLLFRRASSLPELPGSALRLVHVIDTGSASAKDLERIIAVDPGLTANLLRISNAQIPGVSPPGISTLRAAIMRLGQRSVRTLAVSLILQHVTHSKGVAQEFSIDRFARHSLFVAFLARYLFARKNLKDNFESRWSADEIFAGGLLHDIGMALLAGVSPESYFRVHSFALRTQTTLDASFTRIYGKPVSELGRTAVEAWSLPDIFSTTLRYGAEPWGCPDEYGTLCCLNYANYLALTNHAGTEDWPVNATLMPEVEEEVGLGADEAAKVVEYVESQVSAYLSVRDSIAA